MSEHSRWLEGVVVLMFVFSTMAGVAVADVDEPRAKNAPQTDGTQVTFQQQTAVNNSSIRHEDPEEANSEGNLTDSQRWLADQLGDAFVSCARRVENGTGRTCESLNETFLSLASRYVEVAEATENGSDDNAAQVLNQTAADQQAFIRAVSTYRGTLDAYRDARRSNEPQRARRLARTISRDGDRVVTVGQQLSREYRTIASNSTISVTEALDITEAVTANVSSSTDEIRTTEFESSELRLSSNETAASFSNPVSIRGSLQTQNGTGLVNRSVVVRTPEGETLTQTDGNGTFEITYRPTTAPVGNTTIVAEYLPSNDSRYMQATARTQLSIQQTEAQLRMDQAPRNITFGDEVRVHGSLGLDGTPASGVPVIVSVGGLRLGETVTNDSGRFTVSESLPAAVPAGSPTLEVRVAQEGRAVTAEPATTAVRVNRSKPVLSVRSERLDPDTVRISGSIVAGGVPVSDATLQVQKGGATIDSVDVSENGGFETNISIQNVAADEKTNLTLVYDPSGGNLEPTNLVVPVSAAPGLDIAPEVGESSGWLESTPLGDLDLVPLAIGVVILVLMLLVASGAAYSRRIRLQLAALGDRFGIVGALLGVESKTATEEFDPEHLSADELAAGSDSSGVELLRTARTQLSGGRLDDAVVASYTAACKQLDAQFDIEPSLTHWELLALYRDSLDDRSRDALERLTDAYEQAAFSPEESSLDTANDAVESADIIVGDEVSTHPEETIADD